MTCTAYFALAFLLFVGFWSVWSVLVAGPYRLGGGKRARRYMKLADLVRDVSRIVGLRGTADVDGSSLPRLDRARFAGRLASGREARLEFLSHTSDSWTTQYVRLRVAADDAPELKISMLGASVVVSGTGNVAGANPTFDSRYRLETPWRGEARLVLDRWPELRTAIDRLFSLPRPHPLAQAPTVELRNGQLTYTTDISSICPEDYAFVLSALDSLARLFDRAKLTVRVIEGDARAAVDERGKTRCPYCHGPISGDEETLVACERCRTVLHEGCWTELGHCPILGCTGHDPGRRRAR